MTDASQFLPYIKEYEVAHGFNANGLAKEVNAYLKKGFMPYGQPLSKGSDGLFQAMVKLDDRFATISENALNAVLS